MWVSLEKYGGNKFDVGGLRSGIHNERSNNLLIKLAHILC